MCWRFRPPLPRSSTDLSYSRARRRDTKASIWMLTTSADGPGHHWFARRTACVQYRTSPKTREVEDARVVADDDDVTARYRRAIRPSEFRSRISSLRLGWCRKSGDGVALPGWHDDGLCAAAICHDLRWRPHRLYQPWRWPASCLCLQYLRRSKRLPHRIPSRQGKSATDWSVSDRG